MGDDFIPRRKLHYYINDNSRTIAKINEDIEQMRSTIKRLLEQQERNMDQIRLLNDEMKQLYGKKPIHKRLDLTNRRFKDI